MELHHSHADLWTKSASLAFFSTLLLYDLHELSRKWRERVKCDGLWECLLSLMQVFPARQLKNGNSRNRMHISFCFLLIKKSVMTDTISRPAALYLATGVAYLQARGLGAGSTKAHLCGPATHIAGERGRGLDRFLTQQSLLLFTSSCGHISLQLKQPSSYERRMLVYLLCNVTGWGMSPSGMSCTGRMMER